MNRIARQVVRFAGLQGILALLLVQSALGQVDTLNPGMDDVFAEARTLAFSGRWKEARELCALILKRYPDDLDARILLGRTFAWDRMYTEARRELKRALAREPRYKDALNALTDVELWSEQNSAALEVANQGLQYYPTEEDFLLKKIKALRNLGRDDEASFVLMILEDLNPSHSEIATLRDQIRLKSLRYGLGVSYSVDLFSTAYDAVHYGMLQGNWRSRLGSLFGRINYARRFSTNGVQAEFDMYPTIAEGIYSYLNYGFSNTNVFPKHRFGAELYVKLPPSFEGSAGIRSLYFGSGSSVTIYTGSIGLYYGSYWVSLRPYITPGEAGVSRSISLTGRRYLATAEDFLSIRLSTGLSPDERIVQANPDSAGKEVLSLQSQGVGIGWQQNLDRTYQLIVSFDVTNQELRFNPGNYVTIYSFSLGVRLKL